MSGYHNSPPGNSTPSGPPRPFQFTHAQSSSSTPTTRSPAAQQVPTSNLRNAGRSSASSTPAFTPAQRDRQARGKDPYSRPGSLSDDYDDDDDMDLDDFTPLRGGTRNISSGSTTRLFPPSTAPHRASARPPRRHHDGSDSSDMDYDEYDPRCEDFVGGISSRFGAPRRGHLHPGPGAGRQRGETFESWRKREHARDVLERPELLTWQAASRADVSPRTLHLVIQVATHKAF